MNNQAVEAEKFDYEKVSEAMNKVIEQRDRARAKMNEITDLLSDSINNSEKAGPGATERALGGNTKDIWTLWNNFYESFDTFSTSMNTMYADVVTAQGYNKEFEATTDETIAAQTGDANE